MSSYAEQEQDARECAELNAQHEAEERAERGRSQSTLAVKGYIVEEGYHREKWHPKQQSCCGKGRATHYYDITYKVDYRIERFIRFDRLEHREQFIDLLHEAGYKYDAEYAVDEFLQQPIPPPPGGTVRP